jgi:hypothetical protein
MTYMYRAGRVILFLGALLAFVPACSSDSPLASFDPVIADLTFSPGGGREGTVVTVTARYSSPAGTPANAFWSTLFSISPTDPDFTASVPVREDCTDCVISAQFVLRQSGGTEDVDVFVLDDEGRRSNSISAPFTSLP